MHRDVALACRASAEATTIAPDVSVLRIGGYHSPGDGGGANYRRVLDQPRHAGHLRSADGAWWEIIGQAFSARQFGAYGDGVTDDSKALQQALDCPLVRSLRLPAGRYRASGLTLRRDCAITGDAADLFWDILDDQPQDMLRIVAPGASVRNLTFSGLRYATLETPVSPHTLLRIDPVPPQDNAEVRLQDLTFIGGSIGCVVGLVSNVFIDRVRFEHCRDYALVLMRGPRRIVINGLIATGIGQYGGLKTDMGGSIRATERLVLNDFVITDCARADTDPSRWQEGLDLVCGFAREFVISNGVISNCGNGGIELKTGGLFLEEDDLYQDMIISNVVINMRGNHHAIVLNWTGPKVNSGKRGRRIVITGNIIRHENATDSGGSGIKVAAWSELHITNNYIEGSHTGINIASTGAADDTARDIRIAGNHFRDVQLGIYAYKGNLEGLDVSSNVIHCAGMGVALAGARCRDVMIAHNNIRQRGAPPTTLACLQIRNARDVVVWNNYMESEHGHAVMVLDEEHGDTRGAVLRNFVRTFREPFRVEGGVWEVFENHLRVAPNVPTLLVRPDARVTAAWNVRGLREATPIDAGSPGDMMLTAGRPTPPPGWWFSTSAEPEAPAWSVLAFPPAEAHMPIPAALSIEKPKRPKGKKAVAS